MGYARKSLARSPVPGRGFADLGGVIALDGLAQARFTTLQQASDMGERSDSKSDSLVCDPSPCLRQFALLAG